jgi:hypothetical protein
MIKHRRHTPLVGVQELVLFSLVPRKFYYDSIRSALGSPRLQNRKALDKLYIPV